MVTIVHKGLKRSLQRFELIKTSIGGRSPPQPYLRYDGTTLCRILDTNLETHQKHIQHLSFPTCHVMICDSLCAFFQNNKVTQLTTPAPKKSMADLEETLRTMSSAVVKGSSGRRWIRGEAIGRGSLGTVFQAMDQQTGELLAVKEGCEKTDWKTLKQS